jgi:hypothetical protein
MKGCTEICSPIEKYIFRLDVSLKWIATAVAPIFRKGISDLVTEYDPFKF